MRSIAAGLMAMLFAAPADAQPQPLAQLEVQRHDAEPPAAGPAATFTGRVSLDSPFRARAPGRVSGSVVSFEAGARTAWHTHPLGQTLIVTRGCGVAQSDGGPATAIRPGDVVWIPAGVRHWHGAGPATAMTHVAIVESLNGERVQWMEHVSDEQYAAGARAAACS